MSKVIEPPLARTEGKAVVAASQAHAEGIRMVDVARQDLIVRELGRDGEQVPGPRGSELLVS
jgi:hypothetical protein